MIRPTAHRSTAWRRRMDGGGGGCRPLGPSRPSLASCGPGHAAQQVCASWSPQWRRGLLPGLSHQGDAQAVEKRTYVRYRSHMSLRWALASSEESGTLFADERAATRHVGRGAYAGMEFLHVNARSIINRVPEESLMPFRYTINPYRGCSHACTYCFARPTHEYLGLGIGEDFERQIVVKINAVERLRAELRASRWRGEPIAMGTNTDPVPARRGQVPPDPGHCGDAVGGPEPVQHPDQVDPHPARYRNCWPRRPGRTDVTVSFSVGTLGPRGVEADRAGHSPAGQADRGAAAPDRGRHLLRRAGRARTAGTLRRRGAAAGRGGGVRRAPARYRFAGVALHLRGSVREHYLQWLRNVSSRLGALHKARFRGWRLPAAGRAGPGGRGGPAGRRAGRRDRPRPLRSGRAGAHHAKLTVVACSRRNPSYDRSLMAGEGWGG